MTQKIESINEKCDACGGDLKFSPIFSCLYCKNCKKKIPIKKETNYIKHDVKATKEDSQKYLTWRQQNKVFKCKNCGSTIVLNSLEYAKNCPYCESSFVVQTKNLPGLPPDAIIPFAFDETEASTKFAQGIKKKWFLPNAFKKKPPEGKIKGLYIPAFSFDAVTSTKYSGVLQKEETFYDANNKAMSTTKTINIAGQKNMEHTDITIETSSKLNQTQLNAILPFDTSGRLAFNEDFLRGYAVEHYDSAFVDSLKDSRNIIDINVRDAILSQYSYSRIISFEASTKYAGEKYLYCVYPIYRVDYDYKDKKYTTLMNGQTGKVGADLPKSKVKIALFALAIGLLIAGFIALGVWSYLSNGV